MELAGVEAPSPRTEFEKGELWVHRDQFDGVRRGYSETGCSACFLKLCYRSLWKGEMRYAKTEKAHGLTGMV